MATRTVRTPVYTNHTESMGFENFTRVERAMMHIDFVKVSTRAGKSLSPPSLGNFIPLAKINVRFYFLLTLCPCGGKISLVHI